MPCDRKSEAYPPGSAFARASTLDQRLDQRFEFWRSLFPRIDLDIADKSRTRQFTASLMRYEAPNGCVFGFGSDDNTHARFAQPQGEFVLLNLTLSGRAELELGGDQRHVIDATTGLLALDGTQPFRTRTYAHANLWMTFPRTMVADILGEDTRLLKDGLVFLPRDGLSRILETHLQMIASEGDGMDERAASITIGAAIDLALGALSQTQHHDDGRSKGRKNGAIFAAAQRHIHANIAQCDLTAASIAQAIGCSRARLYRVFAISGETVGEATRKARLELAATLLTNRPGVPVKQIAHECGYSDAAAFTRAFRGATGYTPSEARQHQSLLDD